MTNERVEANGNVAVAVAVAQSVKINPIPVSVLSGFLGSGKTTLLQYVLQNQLGMKVAVIVNDMAEINVDANMVKKSTKSEKLIEMSNGCICCTLRDDLLEEVKELALTGDFDYILIESTGVAEPLGVAETFTFDIEIDLPNAHGETCDANDPEHVNHEHQTVTLSDIARLDCMITVVDAKNFPGYSTTVELASQRWNNVDEKDDKNIAYLLIDQIEFANVIIINKVELVSSEEVHKLHATIRALNPKATIFETSYCKVPLDEILNTGKFSFEEARTSAGWLSQLKKGEKIPETIEYGVFSFVYRRRKPFHPVRLEQVLDTVTMKLADKLVRSKGFLWLSTRNDVYGDLNQAGALFDLSPGGMWFIALPAEAWDPSIDKAAVEKEYVGEHGDRRQEIVMICRDIQREAVEKLFDEALLTEEEFAAGEAEWASYEDNFESWMASDSEDEDHFGEEGSDEEQQANAEGEPPTKKSRQD